MRRTLVYGTAAALLTVALVLTLIGWGEEPTDFPDWQALILGLVQGFTELLPISSSGHLILVPWAGDWTYLKEHEEFNKTFDVALHLGTLVAVVAYFWSDLIGYVVAWFRSVRRRAVETQDEKIAWIIVVATMPAALIGAAFQSVIEDRLGEPWQIAILLAVFALVLYWADRRPERKEVGDLSLRQGLLVGLAQSLALAPGVSRSGITISAGRFLGLRAMPPRGSRSCSSCRSFSARSCSRATRRDQGRAAGTGGWGRSSSARSPRPVRACSRSTGCWATCAATTTPSSSSTGSCSRR